MKNILKLARATAIAIFLCSITMASTPSFVEIIRDKIGQMRGMYHKPDLGEGYKMGWNWGPLRTLLNQVYDALKNNQICKASGITPEDKVELLLQIPGTLNKENNWEKNELRDRYMEAIRSTEYPITKQNIMDRAKKILEDRWKLSNDDRKHIALRPNLDAQIRAKAAAEKAAAEKAAAEKAAAEKAAAEKAAAEKAAAEKAAAEKAAAEKAAEEKAAAEKAAAEKAAAEKAAAEAKIAAEKAAVEKARIAAEKAAAEKAAAEAKAAAEKAAAEKAAADAKAAAEKAAAEKAAAEKAAAEAKTAAEKKAAEEARIAAEKARKAEEERIAKEKAAAEEKARQDKEMADRIAAENERKAEEERIAAEKKAAEEARIAAEQARKAEEERIAKEKATAEEKARQDKEIADRIAAEKARKDKEIADAKEKKRERNISKYKEISVGKNNNIKTAKDILEESKELIKEGTNLASISLDLSKTKNFKEDGLLVVKEWLSINMDPQAYGSNTPYASINLSNITDLTPMDVSAILDLCKNANKKVILNISSNKNIDDSLVAIINDKLSNIHSLNLSFTSITDGFLGALGTNGIGSLESIIITGTKVTIDAVRKFMEMTKGSVDVIYELALSDMMVGEIDSVKKTMPQEPSSPAQNQELQVNNKA